MTLYEVSLLYYQMIANSAVKKKMKVKLIIEIITLNVSRN